MSDDADLPKALVKKIAKSKLAAIDQENGVEVKDVQISKDALLALSESARVFIHYLTATGNDICKQSKRQIMSLDDVFAALEDLEFGELLPPLKESLEGFKVENKEKSKKRAEQQKKRKLEDAGKQAATANQSDPAEANNDSTMQAGPVAVSASVPQVQSMSAVQQDHVEGPSTKVAKTVPEPTVSAPAEPIGEQDTVMHDA